MKCKISKTSDGLSPIYRYIEINTLNELLVMMETVNEDLILDHNIEINSRGERELEIEIYDTFRE